MTNFSVGSTPLQIVGAGVDRDPLTVQNTGAVSIYLSADPGVSPDSFEYKIDAGGDFVWPPGKSLSVCTGPNLIGQINFGGSGNVHVNSGSTNVTGAVTINGSVPIEGPVTVSGTVALGEGSVVGISGPVAIAGTVPISGNVNIAGGTIGLSGPVAISGGVSVSGSTINVGNALNLAATPVLLNTYTQNYTAAAMAPKYLAPAFTPVSAYSSVIVKIKITGPYLAAVVNTTPALPNYIAAAFAFTDIQGYPSDTYLPQWALATDTATVQTFQMSVTGPYFNISDANNNQSFIAKDATPGAGTIIWELWGSSEVITAPRYYSKTPGMLSDLVVASLFSQPQLYNGTTRILLATRAKGCFITAFNSGATGTACRLDMFALSYAGYISFAGIAAPPTSGDTRTIAYQMPYVPILAQLVTAGGGLLTATIISQ